MGALSSDFKVIYYNTFHVHKFLYLIFSSNVPITYYVYNCQHFFFHIYSFSHICWFTKLEHFNNKNSQSQVAKKVQSVFFSFGL